MLLDEGHNAIYTFACVVTKNNNGLIAIDTANDYRFVSGVITRMKYDFAIVASGNNLPTKSIV